MSLFKKVFSSILFIVLLMIGARLVSDLSRVEQIAEISDPINCEFKDIRIIMRVLE